MSRLFSANETRTGEYTEYALKSIALEKKPSSILTGWFKLNLAKKWNDFVDSMRFIDTVSLDFMYADVHGNYGYYVSGNLPIRNKGEGLFPRKGWTGDDEWQGYVPFEEKPFSLNPTVGYVVAANNKIVDDNYKYYLGSIWATDYRARRITKLIEDVKASGKKFNLQNVAEIQNDVVDTLGVEWTEAFLKHFGSAMFSCA